MKKILLIDDDSDWVDILKFFLESKNYKVVFANDGEEGLKKMQTEKPDLIVVDVSMPRMDGYSFIQKAKKVENFKSTPVIVLTGKVMMYEPFLEEGIKNFLPKPCETTDLLKKIQFLLSNKGKGC